MSVANISGVFLNKAIHRNPPELTQYKNLDENNITQHKHKPIVVTTTSFEGCLPETSEEKIDFTRTFPDELVLKILSFLSPEGLGKCAQVSRRFNECSCDNSLWRAFVPGIQIPEELKEEVSNIKDYILKVGFSSIEELGGCVSEIYLNRAITMRLNDIYTLTNDATIFNQRLAHRVNFNEAMPHIQNVEIHIEFLENPRCHYFARIQCGDDATWENSPSEKINYIFIEKVRNDCGSIQRIETLAPWTQLDTENGHPKQVYRSSCLPIIEDEEEFEFEAQLKQAVGSAMVNSANGEISEILVTKSPLHL